MFHSRTRCAAAAAFILVVTAAYCVPAQPSAPGEWPQWRGPDRTGVSRETGLLKTWPPGGPRLLWKVEGLGGGYSTPSISRGKIFGMGYRGEDEIVWSREAATGRELWSVRIAEANQNVGFNEGSRSTPTIVGDRLYTLGVNGDVVCLATSDGAVVWRKNLVTDFSGHVPGWGYSESLLVDGDRVIATPGGRAATVVALRSVDGSLIWKAQVPEGDPAHYASPIAVEVEGVRQYVQFLGGGVVGLAAADGKFLWRYNGPANGTANISTPIHRAGHVFAASGYGKGGGLVRLTSGAAGWLAEQVYFTPEMQNHHGGMVLVGDHLYGISDPSVLRCLDFMTGAIRWESRAVGTKGSLASAEGQLYIRTQRGTLLLVDATPERYVEKGRFEQPMRTGKEAWSHPVVAGGRLYVRDQNLLFCYEVKQAP